MNRLHAILPPIIALAACASAGDAAQRLAPRAAETIDPRAAVIDPPVAIGAPSAAIAAETARLVAQARSTVGEFARLEEDAASAVAAAGAAQSESWIVAQQALSALEQAHGPAARAAAALDALMAGEIAATGGIAPADRLAIERAQVEVNAIDSAQAGRIRGLAGRLSR